MFTHKLKLNYQQTILLRDSFSLRFFFTCPWRLLLSLVLFLCDLLCYSIDISWHYFTQYNITVDVYNYLYYCCANKYPASITARFSADRILFCDICSVVNLLMTKLICDFHPEYYIMWPWYIVWDQRTNRLQEILIYIEQGPSNRDLHKMTIKLFCLNNQDKEYST